MLFYIQSTDSSCYQTIKFSTNTFNGNDKLEFRINQLSTIATFLITTIDDYIIFEIDGRSHTYYFQERCKYDRDTLASELTTLFEHFNVVDNLSGTLTVTGKDSTKDFRIIDASHRAKLLLGLYHTQLPTILNKSLNIKSVPYTCYGNNLYLRSRVSSIVGFNDFMNNDIYISLCYHVFEILYSGMPIISRQPGSFTKIKPTDLTNLEFNLVDFQTEPVLLKAPLSVVLEVRRDD